MALSSCPAPRGATTSSCLALFCNGLELRPEGRIRVVDPHLHETLRQLGQALGTPKVAGKEEAAPREQGGGWFGAPSSPPLLDTEGPLSSRQPTGKGSGRGLLYAPWFCLQEKRPVAWWLSTTSQSRQNSLILPEELPSAGIAAGCTTSLLAQQPAGSPSGTRSAAAEGPLGGGAVFPQDRPLRFDSALGGLGRASANRF